MLLSPETYAAARRRFDSLLTGPAACAAPAIRTALEGLDPDDAQALVWCYAASPLSDWLNTPPPCSAVWHGTGSCCAGPPPMPPTCRRTFS